MAKKYMPGAKIPYTCTTGPKQGSKGAASGVQLGKYTSEQAQNRQRKNPSNGGTGNGFTK